MTVGLSERGVHSGRSDKMVPGIRAVKALFLKFSVSLDSGNLSITRGQNGEYVHLEVLGFACFKNYLPENLKQA